MRYIHDDATSICIFIADNNLKITRHSIDEQCRSNSASTVNILDMQEKSYKLWGTSLDYFFFVSSGEAKEEMDIKKAIEYVESGKLGGFILVAYQDGGLISVSGKVYPFQERAESAAWWYV